MEHEGGGFNSVERETVQGTSKRETVAVIPLERRLGGGLKLNVVHRVRVHIEKIRRLTS